MSPRKSGTSAKMNLGMFMSRSARMRMVLSSNSGDSRLRPPAMTSTLLSARSPKS